MKFRANKSMWILILSIVIVSGGCAFTTANVDISYMPETKSPLMTIKPITIALQVEDQRNPEEQDRVGDRKNNLGMVTASVKSKKEVTVVLYDALKNELENNGHKIVNTKEDKYDAFIKVLLKKYWSDFKTHFFDIEMIGTINADVSIQKPQNGSVIFSKVITSTFRESKQMATEGAFKSVLNGVLVEFVRSFSRDPGILEALKNVHEK